MSGSTIQSVSTVAGGRYQHFNQYLHTADIPRIGDYESSVHRLARAAQLSTSIAPPSTPKDILNVLSDTTDTEYPIYRSYEHATRSDTDPYTTQTTTLFDLRQRRVWVWAGTPAADRPADYTFNISSTL